MSFKSLVALFVGDKIKRYEAKHDLVVSLAERWGFRAYNRNLSWHHDDEYQEVWQNYSESKPYIHDRKFTIYSIARSLRSVGGDIAECGVFKAGSSFLMMSASEGTGKRFFGFDSFEGLSEPGEKDQTGKDTAFVWKKNDMAVTLDIAQKNLEKFGDLCTIYKGWIPDRFNEVTDHKFSLIHIDVDLYDPTMSSLEFFFPRMSKGGVIVCDDYGFETCPGARKAMDEFFSSKNMSVIHLPTGQGVVFIR